MINYLIAFILFASPCLAVMGLGGLPYPGPGVGGSGPTAAITRSDDFNRANETVSASANWDTVFGVSSLSIGSQVVNSSSSGGNFANYWSADTFGNNQKVTVDIVTNGEIAVIVRASVSAQTYYIFEKYGTVTRLGKMVAGTWTQIGSNYPNAVAGQTIGLSVVGTTLTPYINAVAQTSQTDSDIASGQPGIMKRDNYGTLDNFVAEEL